jgi:hypothetical protein
MYSYSSVKEFRERRENPAMLHCEIAWRCGAYHSQIFEIGALVGAA